MGYVASSYGCALQSGMYNITTMLIGAHPSIYMDHASLTYHRGIFQMEESDEYLAQAILQPTSTEVLSECKTALGKN